MHLLSCKPHQKVKAFYIYIFFVPWGLPSFPSAPGYSIFRGQAGVSPGLWCGLFSGLPTDAFMWNRMLKSKCACSAGHFSFFMCSVKHIAELSPCQNPEGKGAWKVQARGSWLAVKCVLLPLGLSATRSCTRWNWNSSDFTQVCWSWRKLDISHLQVTLVHICFSPSF